MFIYHCSHIWNATWIGNVTTLHLQLECDMHSLQHHTHNLWLTMDWSVGDNMYLFLTIFVRTFARIYASYILFYLSSLPKPLRLIIRAFFTSVRTQTYIPSYIRAWHIMHCFAMCVVPIENFTCVVILYVAHSYIPSTFVRGMSVIP